MLTSEDHRQLAERCIRLAKECTKPSVAEYLTTLAANYLDLAEQALRLREPATAVRRMCLETQKLEQLEARMDEIAGRVARNRTGGARTLDAQRPSDSDDEVYRIAN